MAIPAIILQPDEILITETNTTLGITFDATPFQFGYIVKVSDFEGTYMLNQIVGYDPEGATAFIHLTINYTLIKKDKIKFNEGYPL